MERHYLLYYVLGVVIAIWGIFLFFENTYFGAFFYGVPTPSWALWVGQIPLVSFNVIDTIGVVAIVLLFFVARPKKTDHESGSKPSSRRPRRARPTTGSAATTALLWLLLLVFLAISLYALFGLNVWNLWADLKGFLGIHSVVQLTLAALGRAF